jgi:hypothetical protein
MRRMRMMGLCVVALTGAWAVSVMAASSAAAGEYYWCRAEKKGEYTNSSCTTKAFKHLKGKFEKEPVEACVTQKKGEYSNATCTTRSAKREKGRYEKSKGRGFTATGGKASIPGWETPAFGSGKPICTSRTEQGEITGPKTGTDRITFRGCYIEGTPCESLGENGTPSNEAGEIVTNLLDTRLVDYPETITFLNAETNTEETKGPAIGEVWEELSSAEHEPYLVEDVCYFYGSSHARVKGQDTGVLKVLNAPSTSQEAAFENGQGADGLLAEVSGGEGWIGPAPTLEEMGVARITNESGIEVRP